jgi:membrane-associated phospholipid phosphatase
VLVDKSVDMIKILYKIKQDLMSISIVTRLRNGRPGGHFAVEADYLLFTIFFSTWTTEKIQVVLWVTFILSAGVMQPRREADHHHLVYYGTV